MEIKYEVGDIVCHYEQKQPLQITKITVKKKTQQITVFLDNNQSVDVNNPALVFYPQKGDRVVVSVGPFTRWYWRTVATFPYTVSGKGFKNYEKWSDREWMEQYDPNAFPFGIVFDLRWVQDNGMCVVRGEGQEFTVAIACLEVLERVRNGTTTTKPIKKSA